MKNVSYCFSKKHFWLVQYAAGYHRGPVAPPRTDEASFSGSCKEFKLKEGWAKAMKDEISENMKFQAALNP